MTKAYKTLVSLSFNKRESSGFDILQIISNEVFLTPLQKSKERHHCSEAKRARALYPNQEVQPEGQSL